MQIKLKDLVWKETNKEKELVQLLAKWRKFSDNDTSGVPYYQVIFDNAEQIAKEKAEILNKVEQYTKQDIIDMFIEAGFDYDGEAYLTIKDYSKHHKIKVFWSSIYFYIGFNDTTIETRWFDINDRKSIEFYYNIFRNILEFEAGNE